MKLNFFIQPPQFRTIKIRYQRKRWFLPFPYLIYKTYKYGGKNNAQYSLSIAAANSYPKNKVGIGRLPIGFLPLSNICGHNVCLGAKMPCSPIEAINMFWSTNFEYENPENEFPDEFYDYKEWSKIPLDQICNTHWSGMDEGYNLRDFKNSRRYKIVDLSKLHA